MVHDQDIRSFTIEIHQSILDDVRRRLMTTRWTDEVVAEPWHYGPPLVYMRRVAEFWLHDFDWRAQEAALNRFHQFQTDIDGLPIHFIHEEGAGPKPLPIVLTHGWPGSFIEMRHIIPLLTDPAAHGGCAADAFTVVVPSLPGYGFSGRPARPGMDYSVVADMWVKLMGRLGYDRFGAQGGDWGSWVSTAIARQHPGHVIGLHLNYLSTRFRPAADETGVPVTGEEQAYLDRVARWSDAEGAYIAIQATKPLTLAYGLTDSPIGLAAWLIEKFKSWSDSATSPEDAITIDDILTDVMIYWATNTAHSAARFYSGSRENPFTGTMAVE